MITRILMIVSVLLLAINGWAGSLPVKGCVAIYQGTTPISIEVELPAFSGGIFKTDQFHFSNLPNNMTTDHEGRYCYSMQDDRFAYVQAYYYAVTTIEDYNKIFTKLGITTGKVLEWTLNKEAGIPTSGDTGLAEGQITYSNAALDPFSLQHEIGHWVHQNAKKNNDGGDEGAADILAALHSGNSIQGKVDGYYNSLISYDIDTFLQYPDHMISTIQRYNEILQDPVIAEKYPVIADAIKKALEMAKTNPDIEAMLKEPDPYASASIINQPLWHAAVSYGVDAIKTLYIKTISNKLNEPRSYSYSEIANALINQANESDPELSQYLKHEYTLRGVLNMKAPSSINKIRFKSNRFSYGAKCQHQTTSINVFYMSC